MLKRKHPVLNSLSKSTLYVGIVARYKEYQFHKKVDSAEYCHRANKKHSRSASCVHNGWSKLFD